MSFSTTTNDLPAEQQQLLQTWFQLFSRSARDILVVDPHVNIMALQGSELDGILVRPSDNAGAAQAIHPQLRMLLETAIAEVFDRAVTKELSYQPVLKTKALVSYTIHAHPLMEGDMVFAVALFITDESWHSRVQTGLESQLQERQNIINNIEDIVCTLNSEGLITQINRACRSILGFTEAEMTHRHITDFILPKEQDKGRYQLATTIKNHSNFSNILRQYVHKNGQIVWLSWSGVFNANDDTIYCTGRNQTEIIEARKQLELSEKRFRTFFYSNPKPVFIYNTETDLIVSINLCLRKIFGNSTELIGSKASEFLSTIYEPLGDIEREVVQSMGLTQMQVLRKSNGDTMYADVTRQNIQVGTESLMIVILRDVTELFYLSREKAISNTFSAALQSPGDLKTKMDNICSVAAQFVRCSSYELWILNIEDYEVNLLTHSPELKKPAFDAAEIYSIGEAFENTNNPGYQLQPKSHDDGYSLLLPIKSMETLIGLLVLSTDAGHPALSRINFLFPALSQLAQPLSRELNHTEMQTIFNLSEDFLITFDQAGLLKKINHTFAQNFKFSEDSLKSVPFWELLTRETDFASRLKPLFSGKRLSLPAVKMYTADGKQVRITWKFTPIPNRNIFIGAGTDITENLLLNEKLQESLERFNAITASITDGFFALNGNFEIIFWNEVAAKTFRESENLAIGNNITSILQENQLKPLLELCKKADETHESQQQDYLFGKEWFRISVFASTNIYAIFFREVTTEKNYQEELRLSNQRYELVTKATEEAIWDLNILDNSMVMSANYRSLFDYPDEPLDSEVITSHVHPDDKAEIVDSLEKAITATDENFWEADYRIVTGKGDVAYVLNRAFIIRDNKNKPLRIIGSIQDFTERRRTQVLLEDLYKSLELRAKELEISNRDLEEFAYFASHDLQQPLRMIEGLLDLLKKKYHEKLDETGQQLIDYSVEAAMKMKTLVKELLQYSRVGTEKKDYKSIDLNKTVADVIRLYQNDIDALNGTIDVETLPTLNVLPGQIEQLFQNLIGNALKYRPEDRAPHITITATERPDDWEFTVSDNGIGIREKDYKKIFGIFQRLHHASEYSGSGIGLSLCKKIAERHLGEIWVDSQPQVGSTFHFTVKKDL